MTAAAQVGDALPSVVVAVFNAPRETARCLDSLAATLTAEAEVLVIDDASTDKRIGPLLGEWRQRRPGWHFIVRRANRGYVNTANLGLAETRGDVVLLNSDAQATPGWIEGLGRCLNSDPAIATATPWTNNGEIASMPEFCRKNPVPPDPGAVAGIIGRTGRPEYPDLPTAVGFCMAISRRAVDRIGSFDEKAFGAGYGEENDFSMRARAAGLRNVLCDDVYVVHLGNRSFGPLGRRPDEESMQRLLQRHPDYLERVQDFIRDDPLRQRRRILLDALERAGVRMR